MLEGLSDLCIYLYKTLLFLFHEAIQVLDHFREQFIEEMDANSVVHDLLHYKITSDGDYQDIT